jgi:hypothetical protein
MEAFSGVQSVDAALDGSTLEIRSLYDSAGGTG